MENTVTLDGSRLKQIAEKSTTAKATAGCLSDRERIRHFSDIGRTRSQLVREGGKIVDSDYMQFWKDLEAAGVGSIIYGRKGKPDRFAWHYSLKSISKSMMDGSNIRVERVSSIGMGSPPVQEAVSKGDNTLETLTQKVTVVLSGSRVIEMKMPDHLTKDEAEKIAVALRQLAK